jgi:DNA-binding Xre family transcriptional regulator
MNVVIGEIIKSISDRRGINKSEFARRLNMSPTNIHKIFKRKSIDTDLLTQIGEILEYDFFIHYIKTKPADYSDMMKQLGIPVSISNEQEERYRSELENCKEKNVMLEKINVLLEEKVKRIELKSE